MLESLLVNILDKYQVSSWNIRGGNVFSEVTIRFNMAAATDDTVKYRKVPPSRMTRDRQRAKRLPVSTDTVSQGVLDEHMIGVTRSEDIEDNDHGSLDISTDRRIQDIAADQGYSMEPVNTDLINTPVQSPLVQLDGPVDRRSGSHSHNTVNTHGLCKQTMNTSKSSTGHVSMQQQSGTESILSHWQSVQELMKFGASTFGKEDDGKTMSDNVT